MSNIAIKVEGIGKKYELGKNKSGDLRQTFRSLLRRKNVSHLNQQHSEFWALRDINFKVRQGEAIGIIGKNGAGKSTLLKVLSRITTPTTGRFEMSGRVSSLLEVGTGFHPELTGRENIFLNGTILGMKRAEIKSKLDEIISFSGVEKFLNTPVKHYSSGMKVRLAFSVAAHLEPEILIIDEVLAVGDAEFQKKCLGKMEDVTGQGRTVLFVSHNLDAINTLCPRACLLQSGSLLAYDNTKDIIKTYLENSKNSFLKGNYQLNSNLTLTDYLFSPKNILQHENLNFSISFAKDKREKIIGITLVIYNEMEKRISQIDLREYSYLRGSQNYTRIKINGVIKNLPLIPGKYLIGIFINTSSFNGNINYLDSINVEEKPVDIFPYPLNTRGYFEPETEFSILTE